MARRTRRLWTVEEKRSICLQATAPGVSVAQVAQRYAMNANLIFKWLRDPRFAPEASRNLDVPELDVASFLPVEVIDRTVHDGGVSAAAPACSTGTIELTLSCGARLRISGRVDEASLGSVIRAMRSAV